MADTDRVENSLAPVWRATAARIAVLAGTGTALACLLFHVPVRVAAFRGALVLFGVVIVARATAAVLEKAAQDGGGEEART